MTSGTDPHASFAQNDAGLSLLELLITLALMALVMSLALPGMFGRSQKDSADTVHAQLSEALQMAKHDALKQHMTISLLIHPSRLEREGQTIFQLAEGMQFAPLKNGETLSFFADGTSSTANLMVINDHQTMTGVRINGLTGRLSRVQGQRHDQ